MKSGCLKNKREREDKCDKSDKFDKSGNIKNEKKQIEGEIIDIVTSTTDQNFAKKIHMNTSLREDEIYIEIDYSEEEEEDRALPEPNTLIFRSELEDESNAPSSNEFSTKTCSSNIQSTKMVNESTSEKTNDSVDNDDTFSQFSICYAKFMNILSKHEAFKEKLKNNSHEKIGTPNKSFLKIFLSKSYNNNKNKSLPENKSIVQKFLRVIFEIIEFYKISKIRNINSKNLVKFSIFLPDEFLQEYLLYSENKKSDKNNKKTNTAKKNLAKIKKPLHLKQGQQILNNDIFFSNFNELKYFYYKCIFDFLYFEYIIENNRSSKPLELGVSPILDFFISQRDPLEQILSLNIRKFTKSIPLITKELMKQPLYKDSIYKLLLPTEICGFKSEIFSLNYILDNYLHLIEPSKAEINYESPNNLGEFREELEKIIPDEINFLKLEKNNNNNSNILNINILNYIRKSDCHYKPFSLHINMKKSFRGIRRSQIGMRQAIINLGPGQIEFFSIDFCDSEKLEKLLKEKFNSSLEEQLNTFWFPKLEVLVEHQITIHHTILNVNEMVLIPLGGLYYYKTRKETVCFLFDFGFCERNQLEYLARPMTPSNLGIKMFKLFKINTLLMDIANRDLNLLNDEVLKFSYEKIKEVIQSDQENLLCLSQDQIANFSNKKKSKLKFNLFQEPLEYNAKFCDKCSSEIFNYSNFSMSTTGKFIIKCLSCLKEELDRQNSENRVDTRIQPVETTPSTIFPCEKARHFKNLVLVYYKYPRESLIKLLYRMETKLKIEDNDKFSFKDLEDKNSILNSNLKSDYGTNTTPMQSLLKYKKSSSKLGEPILLSNASTLSDAFQNEISENYKFYNKINFEVIQPLQTEQTDIDAIEPIENKIHLNQENESFYSLKEKIQSPSKNMHKCDNSIGVINTNTVNYNDLVQLQFTLCCKPEEYSKDDFLELAKINNDCLNLNSNTSVDKPKLFQNEESSTFNFLDFYN